MAAPWERDYTPIDGGQGGLRDTDVKSYMAGDDVPPDHVTAMPAAPQASAIVPINTTPPMARGVLAIDPRNHDAMLPKSVIVSKYDTPLMVPSKPTQKPAVAPARPSVPVQRYATLTTSSGSKRVIPATLSKAEAASQMAAIDERKKAAANVAKLRERSIDKMREVIGANSAQLQLEADQGNLQARESKAKLDDLNAHLGGIEARLAKAKIDPEHYIKSMTTTQRVLNTVGLILGGLAEGLSGGRVKNAALAMLNNAIDRDIAAQRADMAKKAQQAGMTRAQISTVMRQWQAGVAQRKDAMRALASLELTRAGLDGKTADIRDRYADVALALGKERAATSAASRDKVMRTSTYSSRKVPLKTPVTASGKPMPTSKVGSLIDKINQRKEVERKVKAYIALRAKLGPLSVATEHLPWTAAKRAKLMETEITRSVAKAANSGALSDADVAAFNGFVGSAWSGIDEAKKRANMLLQRGRDKTKDDLEAWRAMGYNVDPLYRVAGMSAGATAKTPTSTAKTKTFGRAQ